MPVLDGGQNVFGADTILTFGVSVPLLVGEQSDFGAGSAMKNWLGGKRWNFGAEFGAVRSP